MIPRSDEGDMIKTSPSAPNSDLLQWILPNLKLLGSRSILLIKNLKFWHNVPWWIRSPQKNCAQFRVRMREIWSKQAPSAPNSNLLQWIQPKLKFLGGLTSFPIAWCKWLGKLAMTEVQNELHTRATLDRKWTYTRLRNRSRTKRGHSGVIWKHGCMWHP